MTWVFFIMAFGASVAVDSVTFPTQAACEAAAARIMAEADAAGRAGDVRAFCMPRGIVLN